MLSTNEAGVFGKPALRFTEDISFHIPVANEEQLSRYDHSSLFEISVFIVLISDWVIFSVNDTIPCYA